MGGVHDIDQPATIWFQPGRGLLNANPRGARRRLNRGAVLSAYSLPSYLLTWRTGLRFTMTIAYSVARASLSNSNSRGEVVVHKSSAVIPPCQ